MRPICLIALMLLAGGALPHRVMAQAREGQNPQMARSMVQKATSLYESHSYVQAQDLFEEAYRLFPNDKIQYVLGRVHEAQQHWQEALSAYQRYLRAVPEKERTPAQTADALSAVKRITAQLGRAEAVPQGKRHAGPQHKTDGDLTAALPLVNDGEPAAPPQRGSTEPRLTRCNPVFPGSGCLGGFGCYAYGDESTNCVPPGSTNEGKACERRYECKPGLSCVGPTGSSHCRRICPKGDSTKCPAKTTCTPILMDGTRWPTYGACCPATGC